MKLRKIMAGVVAGTMAVSTMAVAANAAWVTPENVAAGADIGANYLVQVYNTGNPDENKPATDYGVDTTKIGGVSFTWKYVDTEAGGYDFIDGAIGGAFVISSNGYGDTVDKALAAKKNWTGMEFWGVIDPALPGEAEDGTLNTVDPDKELPVQFEKVGDYTYKATHMWTTEDEIALLPVEGATCVQIAVQEWGSDMCEREAVELSVLDKEGNVMLTFDGNGKMISGDAADDTTAADTEAPADTTAPAADDTTAAPSKGEQTTAPTTDKPNTNTGVEGVAVIAGLAVIATGAVIVSKKRK